MEDNTHLNIPEGNIRNTSITPTGGGKSFPRENMSEHGARLLQKSFAIKTIQTQKKDNEFTSDYYLELSTPSSIPIKQAKNSLEHLGFEFINYSKISNNTATAKINKSIFSEFETKLERYTSESEHPNKSYITFIEDINDVPIESKVTDEINLSSDENKNFIIALYNVLSSKEKVLILENIKKELSSQKIDSKIYTFITGLTTVICTTKQSSLKAIFENYSTVRQISVNHVAILEQAIPFQPIPNPLQIVPPISSSKICVVDSGIAPNSNQFRGLIHQRIPYLPLGSVDSPNDHGTFVASRCIFGDDIDTCSITHKLEPYCQVIDVPVFGIDSSGNTLRPSEIDLMVIIQDLTQKLGSDIKVINLSLGLGNSIKINFYSELAKLIDFLSKRFDKLFIISSGNIDYQLGNFPDAHFKHPNANINSPAESLLSITVGSIAKFEHPHGLSAKNQISPFSRIGPGSDGGIKPELVSHGGNLLTGYNPLNRISTYGLSNDGINIATDNGTSFSAPIIAQYSQKLFDLYPNSKSNLIKALLFHFTNPVSYFPSTGLDPTNFYGFGEPSIQEALYSKINSGAYIYEGKISQNNYQYIKFHVPSLMAATNSNAHLSIKVTLVYNPPINIDNNIEYSCSRITLSVLKPTQSGVKTIPVQMKTQFC